MKFPRVIQGGMGVGVSGWQLARATSKRGQIGVVSGTALDIVLARRLQLGDPGGHMRRALSTFPDRGLAHRVLDRYFIEGGKESGRPFSAKPMIGHELSRQLEELMVAANFVEVTLAKEGHDGWVGINYLHKIQAPLLPSLYGAMLAGVDIVIVGAGIPLDIPQILDSLTRGEPASLQLHVAGSTSGAVHRMTFDPSRLFAEPLAPPPRPRFFPIVSSVTLASLLLKKCQGKVDGWIVEGPTAGGHNAPPRGSSPLSPAGEPVYGPRDAIDLPAIAALGLPFWLAGSYGSREKLGEALAAGAAGIQVGTLFAFCEESGLTADLKRKFIERCRESAPQVHTDPVASPTGFPFKVPAMPGTLSDPEVYAKRKRRCDLGYLREAYTLPDGTLGWRCAAENPPTYVFKGGRIEDTVGRKCLCNGLLANIGLAQVRDGKEEPPLLTCGDDLSAIVPLLSAGKDSYGAGDVIDALLAGDVAHK